VTRPRIGDVLDELLDWLGQVICLAIVGGLIGAALVGGALFVAIDAVTTGWTFDDLTRWSIVPGALLGIGIVLGIGALDLAARFRELYPPAGGPQ
jgi:ABC-type antimicrobial peptide transport system permease subunit